MAVEPVSRVLSCPECARRLRLIPELDGWQIRCTACRAMLHVCARPWQLTVVRPRSDEAARPIDVSPKGPITRPAHEPGERPEHGAGISEDEILDALGAVPTQFGPARSDPVAPGEASDGWEPLPTELPKPTGAVTATGRRDGRNGSSPSGAVEEEIPPGPKPAPPAPPPKPATEPARPRRKAVRLPRLPRPPQVPKPSPTDLAVLLALFALAALGGWWLFAAGPVHPEGRYLPARCEWFVSMRGEELAGSGLARRSDDLPGLALAKRCRTFLKNAGLAPRDVERINAGRAADGSGLLLVYRLARPIRPDEVMEKPSFRGAKYEEERIRGFPVYTNRLADSAIAFVEERVIVNGDAPLVLRAVRRPRRGFGGPASELLDGLDFSATSAGVWRGVPRSLRSGPWQPPADLAESIVGTTDCFNYGEKVDLRRVLHVPDAPTASRLQQSLQSSLAQAAGDRTHPEAMRRMLASVRVSAAEGHVSVELTVDADRLSDDSLESLGRLF
jgi:hypothetical protein